MSNKQYYLAGPMSGLPKHNFPAFEEAAAKLRKAGYTIASPAEMETETFRKIVMADETGRLTNVSAGQEVAGYTRGKLLGRDVELILDECHGIIVLEGWQKSRGARLEVCAALSYGLAMYRYDKIEGMPEGHPGFTLKNVTPFSAFGTMMKEIKRRD